MRPSEADSATLIVAIWAGECVAAALLAVERLAGWSEPLPSPAAVLSFALVCLAVNLMAVALLRDVRTGTGPFFGMVRSAGSTRSPEKWTSPLGGIGVTCVPPLVIGLSLLGPEAAGERIALFAAVLLAAGIIPRMSRRTDCQSVRQLQSDDTPDSEFGVRSSMIGESDSQPSILNSQTTPAPAPTHHSPLTTHHSPLTTHHSPLTTHHSPTPSQWMQRRLSADGHETIEGEFTATFAAGQKTAVVHLAFCPPLGVVPEFECEPVDGPDVRWKLAVAQPYGVRIDVQRSHATDQPAECRIAWFASSAAASSKAA